MDYAIVTGSTSGIGLAAAKKLLEHGLFVYLNYANNDKNAEAVRNGLSGYAGRFDIIKADMSSLDGIDRLAGETAKNDGLLKYLVLNSYATDKTEFADATYEKWRKVMDVNVNMPFFLMQRLFERMAEGGSICCMGSMMGLMPHGVSVSYGVSKAALHMLCKYMVKICAPKRITVNAVCPGFVETPMQSGKTPEHRARIENKIALRRFGTPEEIADAVWMTLTNSYINGAVIQVCGGYCME